ncbi:hypothetical protein ABZU76_06395 [Amycolatopsis sp. NPDC005232]|uniref:hypothetical protein n=1 Tax=Amycolatopsis sp. NPDC005232 TaxID=3157027 RepID=UPI0033A0B682
MSSKPFVHRGSKSWWSGKVTTLCGLVFEPGEAKSSWFTGPACPACEAIRQAKNGK